MDVSDLSVAEAAALQRLLSYWLDAWDWESPTLFGFRREDLSRILEDWPGSLSREAELSSLAVLGVLRESLYGASAIAPGVMASVCGLSRPDLVALADRLEG
jgi:hypothetical protein